MKGLKINYDKTFATKYSRDYYRGASFHYSGKWAAGVHYVADSYNTDFCASHQVLLACKLSHTSDEYNDPAKHFIYDEDQNIIGIKSKYWDIVIAGINIIGETKEWVDERIDGVIEAYKADIEFSARGLRTEFTHDIDDAVNGVTRNYRSEISQTAEEIRSTVEAVETSLDGKMEENYSELKQRADSISATVAQNKSDIEGNLEQKYSELKMTADEIATTVSDVKTDLEGNISNKFSEISQRADQISARVEEVNSNLNGDLEEKYSELKMTADEITSTVAANKTELDNTIQENYSQLSQRADSITATVAQNRSDLEENIEQRYAEMVMTADEISTTVAKNKSDLEGNIESKFSEVSQKADEIAARVEEVSQQSTGELEKKYSELIMTTDAISATVAANKTATDGSISDLSSNITQTATEIRSEVSQKITDVDGKVEEAKSSISQTAEQIMATVEANKTELDGTISANYSELKQTAEEISATVTANKTATDGRIEKNYSELKQTAEEISSTVASNKKAAEDALDAVNEELSSRITQTSEAITSEVEARTTREGEIVSDYTSKIQQTAEAITSEVSAREAAIEGVQTDYNSKISQTADNITSSVKETTDALGERLTTAETSITQNTQGISLTAEKLNTLETSVGERFAADAELLRSLQNQVDGAIETYYENYEPTLQNAPASNWTTDEVRENHVGDLFYNKITGYSYRFFNENGTYKWSRILDSDITTALAKAAEAKTTADGKMTIFYTQPSTYRKGDLWIAENNENECIIKKSNYARDNNYVSTDWVEVSDLANATKVRSAFSVLADMIQSEVGEYTSDNNLVPGSLYSKILQSRDHISAKIGKAVSDSEDATAQSLLDTGIDIEDKKITLTADHVYLKNNAGATSALSVVTVNNTPVISAENLQLTGVFSTSAWNANKTALEQYAEGKANTAQQNAIDAASTDATNKANTAEANAKGYADTAANTALESAKTYANSTDYLTNYIVPKVTAGTNALKEVLEGEGGSIKAAQDTANSASIAAGNAQSTANSAIASIREVDYLKNALLEEDTTIAGGLILSTLIQLGSGAKTDNWQVYSGLNGSYQDPTSIAFWAGGDMTESGSRAAKAVIRMDGTGYLAGGNISWDASGNASFNGDVVAKSFTIGTSDWNDVKSGILNDAASDATTKANNAQSAAISAAANDATTKANAAETNAKSDTTTKITSLKNKEIKAAKDAADAADNKAITAQNRADSAYTLANSKANPGDITDAKDVIAQNLGYTNYSDMAAKAAAGKTIINGGYLRTELIETSAITIGSGQVTGLGTLATKSSISATSGDITGLGSLATKSTVSAINGDVTGLAGVATSGNYNDLSNKPDIPDVSGLAGKDDFAKKLGYTDYNAMVAAAQAGNTIISGSYIKTGLIDTDALVVKHLSGADGTFTGTLSGANGSFSGSITANSGQIGGWTIQSNYLDLYDPDNNNHILRMGYWEDESSGDCYVFAAGNDWVDDTEFNFSIDAEGKMCAQGVNISGEITASSGEIGGFTISSSKLYNSLSMLDGTSDGVYLGTDGIALGGGKFKVTKAGYLTTASGQIAQFIVDSEKLSYGFQHDNHTTSYFYLTPKGMTVGLEEDESNYPIYDFSINTEDSSNSAVCTITRHASTGTALKIDVGQTRSTAIEIYDAALYSTYICPDEIYMYNTQSRTMPINISATNASIITCNVGMFAGLRPKTRYITSSSASSERYLDSLDYTVIINNASSLTIYLPSSPKDGQTYCIKHLTTTTVYIQGRGNKIFSMSSAGLEDSSNLVHRGTYTMNWSATYGNWIIDELSSYQ